MTVRVERRRLRRDLHDGLGPALAGTVLRLDATARHLPTQPGRATELLSGVRTDLKGTIAEIAARLGLSPKTVRNRLSSIFAKLRVRDRAEAIVRGRDAGLGRAGG